MDLNRQLTRKRRHPFRTLFLALLVLGSFLLLLLLMLVFHNNENAIGLGMFGGAMLFFLLHYLLWGRVLSLEIADGEQTGRSPELTLQGRDIPAEAALLPSGERRTEDGIRCAEPSRELGASSIQRPQPNP